MARYKNGINGTFMGKVGTVVGSVWNGLPYMRSAGNPRTAPAGENEQANRDKFAAAHLWLKPLLPLLREGFKGYSPTSYGYNAAKSYTLKYGMEGGQVQPARVKISLGDLPLSDNLSATIVAVGKIDFIWSTDNTAYSDRNDQVMVLAYHPESATAIYEIHGAFRHTGIQTLNISTAFAGKTLQLYAAFIAADRSRQSDSVYLGAINPH
jgi:hypothetical protein